MKKAKKRQHKIVGQQTKQREVFRDFIGEEVTITGIYDKMKNVISLNYVGKSILLTDIVFNDYEIQHMWIHKKAINNFPDNIKKGDIVTLKGTVYCYTHQHNKRVLAMKYSLKDINIIKVKHGQKV